MSLTLVRAPHIKFLIERAWIDKLVMIAVGSEFKTFVTTALNAVFFFDSTDHVLTDTISMLCKVSMQSLTAIALLSLIMSYSNQ